MGRSQQGQTLIETIVAIFVLTSGLSAGLALAIYSFGSSSDISERISATALAREGVEGVRRMRDSNWLWGKQNSQFVPCADLGTGQSCYPKWLTAPSPYPISGNAGSGLSYRLKFDPSVSGNKYTLDSGSDYKLYIQPGGGINHDSGFGTATNLFRKIYIIYQSQSAGYTATSPLVMVRSVVWWWGKNCPQNTDYNPPTTDTPCKIVSEANLTNWKNY